MNDRLAIPVKGIAFLSRGRLKGQKDTDLILRLVETVKFFL